MTRQYTRWDKSKEELLELLYMNGKTHKEISEIFGISENSISTKISEMKLPQKKDIIFTEDLTGKKFNKLNVICYYGKDSNNNCLWKCLCDCQLDKPEGERKYTYTTTHQLKKGKTKSCGCLLGGHNKIDMIGKKFGRLFVIEEAKERKNKMIYYKCICDCQLNLPEEERKYFITSGNELRRGNVKSCGCLQKELVSKRFSKQNKYDIESFPWGVGWTNNTNDIFIFDKEDYDKIKNYCWYVSYDKKSDYCRLEAYNKMNANNTFEDQRLVFHQVVTGKKYQDHINHDTLDNRKLNLRDATNIENGANQSLNKNNTSGITGVSYDTRIEKWVAYITVNYKTMYLGSYMDKNDAVHARLLAEQKYFGEFSPQKHLYERYGIDNE